MKNDVALQGALAEMKLICQRAGSDLKLAHAADLRDRRLRRKRVQAGLIVALTAVVVALALFAGTLEGLPL